MIGIKMIGIKMIGIKMMEWWTIIQIAVSSSNFKESSNIAKDY